MSDKRKQQCTCQLCMETWQLTGGVFKPKTQEEPADRTEQSEPKKVLRVPELRALAA